MIRIDVTPPASKKNRRKWIKRGRRRYLVPSDEATASENEIRAAVRDVLRNTRGDSPAFPSADVGVDVIYHARSELVEIEITELAPRPKGFSGRRCDLHGMFETIADALEGEAFTNDNQIAKLTMERRLD